MAWIQPSDVSGVYPAIVPSQALCDHVQGLAEAVIGSQEEPITNRLKAVMVEIVTQFHSKSSQAAQNPTGFKQERIDDYEYVNYESSGPLGLGLTEKAKAALRLAAGLLPLQTVGTYREALGVEMAEPYNKVFDVDDPDLGL